MNLRYSRVLLLVLVSILIITACAPPAPTPPSVDSMGTMIAQLASSMQTQTAAAYSPTPQPATATNTPSPTETFTASIAAPTKRPTTLRFTGCWYGPGPAYELESNINPGQKLDLLGVGSVAGWYVVKNPYFHKPCWVSATDLEFDPRMDTSIFPVMTPGS